MKTIQDILELVDSYPHGHSICKKDVKWLVEDAFALGIALGASCIKDLYHLYDEEVA